jgi:UDP-glucose 4-epimerase
MTITQPYGATGLAEERQLSQQSVYVVTIVMRYFNTLSVAGVTASVV